MAPADRAVHGIVFTVGHSTQTFEELVGLLRAHGRGAAGGHEVRVIMSEKSAKPRKLNPTARVKDRQITYRPA